MGYTYAQLQQMGATPVQSNNSVASAPKVNKGYSFEELVKLGAQPVESVATAPASTGKSTKLGIASKITDAIFGSGKVGEALGTSSAKAGVMTRDDIIMPNYANLSESVKQRLTAKGVPTTEEAQRKEVADTITGPSAGQIAGSVAQSALFLTPEAKLAGSIGTKVGSKILGKVGAGAVTGYGYDVAQNIQEGDKGLNIFKPGVGTALGAVTPIGIAAGAAGLKAGVGAAKTAAPVVAGSLEGVKNVITAPFKFLGEKAKNMVSISKLPEAEKILAKSGIDERSREFLKTATGTTKDKFRNMIDLAEKSSKDLRARTQPKQIVGQSLLERVEHINKDSVKARKVINATAMSGGKVDLAEPLTEFVNLMEKKGIVVGKGGRLVSTGRIPRADLPYYESIFKEIQDVTGGRTEVSKLQAHRLRQRLRDTLDAATKNSPAGAVGQRPFSDIVDKDINDLRGFIADQMGTKYKDAAKNFAQNESVLRDVAKFAGVPNDWEKLSAKDLKLGEVLMRSLGNAADRPQSLIDAVEALAKKRGGKFGDNINDLIQFADNLEDLYGITQTRGFEGGIRKGVSQAGTSNIPTGKIDLIMKAAQAATKTSNQDKINALKAFLGVK